MVPIYRTRRRTIPEGFSGVVLAGLTGSQLIIAEILRPSMCEARENNVARFDPTFHVEQFVEKLLTNAFKANMISFMANPISLSIRRSL
jgi:hypothetical protein